MLHDKVIIYDDSCPMCKLYTYWFVAWGFLKAENRIGFSAAPVEITSKIDLHRGRHEIPLFDRTTLETHYGLTALTTVVGSRWTWLKPFFQSRLFLFLFYPLYQIITFNRRVISGCPASSGFDCAPDLNRFYRSIYLVMAGSVIFFVVTGLLLSVGPFGTVAASLIGAFAVYGIVRGTMTSMLTSTVASWDYFGNLATSMLMVVGLCLPLIFWPSMSPGLAGIALAAASVTGVEEMIRRRI